MTPSHCRHSSTSCTTNI